MFEPVVLMPVLWAGMTDDEGAVEGLHDGPAAEWGWAAVAAAAAA